MTTRVDDLRKIPLFSRLSSVDLDFLGNKVDEVRVPAGTALITEGMGNYVFYLLAHGEVDVGVWFEVCRAHLACFSRGVEISLRMPLKWPSCQVKT